MNLKLSAVLMLFLLVFSCAPKQAVKPVETVTPAKEAEALRLPDIAPSREPEEGKKTEPPAAEKKTEEQFVMLNFENADIETVIQTIGEMLKINYIVAPGVGGKITIQSHHKVPLSELFSTFQTILEFNGFTAVKYGSFYRIVPIDAAKQQPVRIESGKTISLTKDASFVTQEIPLEYVKANDVANIVRNLMPRGTDIVVYEPSNMLIITAPPVGIVKFLKLLEAIDIPATDRDAIKTFVYYVENGEAKKLVEILKNIYTGKRAASGAPVKTVTPAAAPAPAPVPTVPRTPVRTTQAGASVQEGLAGEIEGEVLIEAYEDINAILIKSSPRGYLTLLETIKKLDVQPKQVLIEVLIAEITLDDTTQFGIEWLLKTSVHAEGKDFNAVGGFTNTVTSLFDSAKNEFIPALSTGSFVNVLDPNRFNLILKAAATKDQINVLASPHILALDNKEAKIEIADEVPVATSISQPQETTANITSQVQFKSAGTILTVTPHINEKKQVTLKISQEVSEVGSTVKIGGQDYQGFKTRKATTSAIVQDGHTLVLGGIITDRVQKTRNGVPLLSDIPILGYLFGSTTDKSSRKELILMVTPRVVGSHEEADEMSKELKDRVQGLKEKIEKSYQKKAGEGGID